MAIPKVLGTETEYGIAAVGVPGFQPRPLVVAVDLDLRRIAQTDPLGLRARVAPPGCSRLRADPFARGVRRGPGPRERDPPQRREVLRGSRASRVLDARMPHAARAGHPRQGGGADPRAIDGRGHHADAGRAATRDLQEQLRREGQLLRHARELPRRPADPVRRHRPGPDPVLRLPPGLLRCGQARLRGAVGRARAADLPAHAARGLLRDRGRPGDHAEATDHQHAGRAPRRSRRSTGVSTSSSGTPTCARSRSS